MKYFKIIVSPMESFEIEVGDGIARSHNTISTAPDNDDPNEIQAARDYKHAIDGIEALLLGMASEGVDLNDERIQSAVQTAVHAAAENLT